MDSNILAVGISAVVLLVVAVGTSIYTTRKNIKLEKEMYFRKTKIEDISNEINLLDDLEKLLISIYDSEKENDLVLYEFCFNRAEEIVNCMKNKSFLNYPYNREEENLYKSLKFIESRGIFVSGLDSSVKNIDFNLNFKEVTTENLLINKDDIDCYGNLLYIIRNYNIEQLLEKNFGNL